MTSSASNETPKWTVVSRAPCKRSESVQVFREPSAVPGRAESLADIYTHAEGSVERLTDGLLASDYGEALKKSERDSRFPLSVIRRMMGFDW